MTGAARMVELWRGPICESVHLGHAAICDASGTLIDGWGDPAAIIYPRSSCKMVQALPMVEAGLRLSPERLALACASHDGTEHHVTKLRAWLADEGLADSDLACGRQPPLDRAARHAMLRAGVTPCQVHNQCSGKHVGFLQFHRYLGATDCYVDPDGVLQRQVRRTLEELTGEESPGCGIDGCAAPNFATSVGGLARAMARFAGATPGQGARPAAMVALREAMMAHPVLVGGAGTGTTGLMQAARGRAAVKFGAEGVYVAILPERALGVALKITDGAGRAAETAVAALLLRLGVVGPEHPVVRRALATPVANRVGDTVGTIRPAPGFP